MGRNKETSAVVDGLLKLLVAGSALGAAVLAPNAVQALDKPLQKFFDNMDRNQRERELKRITGYMKTRKLVTGSYQHGLVLTAEGRKRARNVNLETVTIDPPDKWDNKWRLVFFDIPQNKSSARNAFTRTLRLLGFQLLQQSIWIHPFPCRDQVAAASSHYGVTKWVSYIETDYIDRQEALIKRFNPLLSKTTK